MVISYNINVLESYVKTSNAQDILLYGASQESEKVVATAMPRLSSLGQTARHPGTPWDTGDAHVIGHKTRRVTGALKFECTITIISIPAIVTTHLIAKQCTVIIVIRAVYHPLLYLRPSSIDYISDRLSLISYTTSLAHA